MTPTADDLNRGVAAVHAALAPKLGRLEDLIAVALRSLAAIVAADLASGATAAADPAPWTGPAPDALTDELRRRHDEAWRNRHEAGLQRVQIDAMRTTYGELGASMGLDFDLRNPTIDGQVRELRNRSTLPESSWRIVRESLQSSHDAGLGIPEAARQLRTQVAGMAPYRARMIARTELIGIANRGSLTAARLAGIGGYKSWLATADARVRDAHWRANGQTVPIDNRFTVGGEELDYPGDHAGSAGNVINCFPGGSLVEAAGVERGYRRWYDGPMVRVTTAAGHDLAGTPNHPVLTPSGWVTLGSLRESDHLIGERLGARVATALPDVQDGPTAIEQVVAALAQSGDAMRVVGSSVDFHGDGTAEGEVDVVGADRTLRIDRPPANGECRREFTLALPDHAGPRDGSGEGSGAFDFGGVVLAAPGRMGGTREALALSGRGALHTNGHRSAAPAWLNAMIEQDGSGSPAGDPEGDGERLLGFARDVSAHEVVSVHVEWFAGHVYNLQTASGAYLCNGIVSHNCRCTTVFADTPDGYTGEVADSGLLGIVPDLPPPPPAGASIREGLDVRFKSAKRRVPIDETLDAIDKVHTLPRGEPVRHVLPIEQGGATKSRAGAYFHQSGMSGSTPVRIRMNVLKDPPVGFDDRVTLAHEYGHHLDHWWLRSLRGEDMSRYTSREAMMAARSEGARKAAGALTPAGEAVVDLFRAIMGSDTYTKLGVVRGAYGRYLRSAEELWARSYAQWIAVRSGNEGMMAAIRAGVERRVSEADAVHYGAGLHQWHDDEFGPIAEAFDRFFREAGMMRDA